MMKLYYQVKIFDHNGKVVTNTGRRISRSYIKQWNQVTRIQAGNLTDIVLDIGGIPRNIIANANNLNVNGVIGQVTAGIVFGTDDTAVLISDWKLNTQITEGVGANQMNHQAMVFGAAIIVGQTCRYLLTRLANNNSGAAITIKEIALYGRCHDGGAVRYVCYARDVLSPPVVVPDTFPVTGQYTVQVIV